MININDKKNIKKKYKYRNYSPGSARPVIIIKCSSDEFFNMTDRQRIIKECGFDNKNYKIGFSIENGL